jgi:hypothetical protein
LKRARAERVPHGDKERERLQGSKGAEEQGGRTAEEQGAEGLGRKTAEEQRSRDETLVRLDSRVRGNDD